MLLIIPTSTISKYAFGPLISYTKKEKNTKFCPFSPHALRSLLQLLHVLCHRHLLWELHYLSIIQPNPRHGVGVCTLEMQLTCLKE